MTSTCRFCTIQTSLRLLADSLVFAVRESRPLTEGHTIVVLRRHAADYFGLPAEEQAAIWRTVARVKASLDLELVPPPRSYSIRFDSDSAMNDADAHVHVHVVPHHETPERAIDDRRTRVVTGGSSDPLLRQLLPALDGATHVDLALAFIFDAGVDLLHDRLVDTLRRPGARVRILTGDYQDVTEPVALQHILNLRAIADTATNGSELELKVYQVASSISPSFHPKAWIVGGPDRRVAWVGSSNLSRVALETGVEWNYQMVDDAAVDGVHVAFESLWHHHAVITVDGRWIDEYERRRHAPTRLGRQLETAAHDEAPTAPLLPRPGVQREALLRLEQARSLGERAGLVVLATGLGKTYLSAFDSRGFERVLFVAHREEILSQALETFRRVRPEARLGVYHGAEKEPDADLLFASVQTLSSREHLEAFDPRHFDYVVIDEFHHAAADTYRRIIDHFEPKFMLGLTATPDRTDGSSLLSLCDGNEIYRAGIRRGIDDGQLAPFRYFGIGDIADFDPSLPWRDYTEDALTKLVATDPRASHVLATLDDRAPGPIRALAFCVSKAHADFMAAYFLSHGRPCAAVYSGSTAPRTASLEALARGDLELIFCVDMFNEGVDVPTIDTVLMLRPTGSAIVWLQQLGRGLRHVEGKTLTVLDYIGNHEVFLRRPEMLFTALELTLEHGAQRSLQALRDAELPSGVEVDFDLHAKDILTLLERQAARSGSKAERWYREFRALHGVRPTALEAERAGHLKTLAQRGEGWIDYVQGQGDLSADEIATFARLRPFFVALEATTVVTAHELLVLLALLHLESFPGRVKKTAIADWIGNRARRSTAIMREFAGSGGDRDAIRRLLEEDAFGRVAALAGGAFLRDLGAQVDSASLGAVHRESLRRLAIEIIEALLTPYLDRANKSATKLPPMRNGSADVDARFDVEAYLEQSSIIFHSRGEAAGSARPRNTQYREGLTLLLRRLSEADLDIERIEVDSIDPHIKRLPAAQRVAVIPNRPFPWRMRDQQDHETLARAIGSATKKIGQKPGTKGGNDTRRLRIVLRQSVAEGELWHRLSGR